MLMIWRNQLRAITSQHVRKSRPALAVKLTEYIKKAARETGFLSGKWLIFGEGRSIEVQWVKVKEAVFASKLGACAKLSEKTHDRPRVDFMETRHPDPSIASSPEARMVSSSTLPVYLIALQQLR